MRDDNCLLEKFARERSEPAFGELVARHIGLVYATALRAVHGDAHLAQDVTQTVFIDLARKAGRLPRGVVLSGWLHRHTCYTAATAVRTERRRKTREQTAMEIRALDDNTEPPWELVAPYLDESLNQLNSADRDALVLRFLDRLNFRAVGAALGISEDAAQKRVSRALEKLHRVLKRRGVTVTAAALAAGLGVETVAGVPAGLAVAVTAAATAAAAETAKTFAWLKLIAGTKLELGVISALVVASLAAPLLLQHEAKAGTRNQEAALRGQGDLIAASQQEKERLSHLLTGINTSQTFADDQFRQILRLRDEVGRLHADVQRMTKSKSRGTPRNEVLAAMRQLYPNRVKQLKELFETNPSEAVPELQYLTDRDWLSLAEVDLAFDSTNDDRRSLSDARTRSQMNFSMELSQALGRYGKANNGQFPTAVSQVAPYFDSPVDDSVLRDWVVVPTSSLPSQMRLNEDEAITQKAPVNANWDQRLAVGIRTVRIGTGGSSQWGPP